MDLNSMCFGQDDNAVEKLNKCVYCFKQQFHVLLMLTGFNYEMSQTQDTTVLQLTTI